MDGARTARVPAADPDAARPWLATEYVPGPTLARHVEDRGPMSGQELTGLAAGLAEALRALHAVNVVHRDLKPSNVILSPSGPKLVDMGIARALEEAGVTRTGVVVARPGGSARRSTGATSRAGRHPGTGQEPRRTSRGRRRPRRGDRDRRQPTRGERPA
ncbi:protein kinase [Nonomuraea rubra]